MIRRQGWGAVTVASGENAGWTSVRAREWLPSFVDMLRITAKRCICAASCCARAIAGSASSVGGADTVGHANTVGSADSTGSADSVLTGAIYIAIVLFLPYGIVGIWRLKSPQIRQGWASLKERFK